MSPGAYISRFFIFGILIAAVVVGFNSAVDPYALIGTVRVEGFNKYKTDSNNYTRLFKKYQPEFQSHNALILGNSRVELGINPAHRCFVGSGWKVYNLGIPGAGVQQQLKYALNIIYQQPIEDVFLSVDFTDFLSSSPQPARKSTAMIYQETGELRYLPSGELNPEFTRKMLVDYYRALFSLDAVVSSLRTIVLQSEDATDRDEAGFNPGRDFAAAVRIEGPAALFGQKMAEMAQKYSRGWYLRDVNGQLNRSLEYIAEFLAIAADQEVQVNLFTNPFHQTYWELMEEQGLLPVYEDWLQSIQSLASLAAKRSGNVTFWDFSADSQYIHESVPAADVKTGPLKWFWEPAHYRRELGDLMVDAMLSESCGTPVKFGQNILE